ncbi:MAG: undecaprenyl-diphosphate phosphatase [Deltaproteobacteria bacterium]
MFNYIILGIIQGLTEFLPVSSSAHLVIMQRMLGIHGEEVIISVVLHLGTAAALCIFFFKDILTWLRNSKMLGLLAATTLVTAAIGVAGKRFFESLFSSVFAVGIALMVTGVILILTRRFKPGREGKDLNIKDALILGLTQGLAIIPGISRSGITISTLLFRKMDRETSFRFSFISAIPVILGAALLKARDIGDFSWAHIHDLSVGFIASLVFGLISLKVVKIFLSRAKLHYFGYYCILAAILTLLFLA